MLKISWKYKAYWSSGDAITFVHALLILCRHRGVDVSVSPASEAGPTMLFYREGDEGVLSSSITEQDATAIRLFFSSFSIDFDETIEGRLIMGPPT